MQSLGTSGSRSGAVGFTSGQSIWSSENGRLDAARQPLSWLFRFVSHTLQLYSRGITVTTVDSPLADALRDRYLLERELGRGGMATVYLAYDIRHDRRVALKVLHPELAATLGPDRFLREIRTAARLQHPHILPVFDSGVASGRLWYTMPFVEGESLREKLRREVQLPVQEAIRGYTRDCPCSGLRPPAGGDSP